MASAVLAIHNASSFMGKIPFSNHHLNPNPNSTKDSKCFSSKRKIAADHTRINGRYVDEFLPDVNQSGPDDASSFNYRRSNISSTNHDQFNQGEYISIDIASYKRNELIKLKRRFNAELDQIRVFTNRIESGEFQFKTAKKEEDKISSKKNLGVKRPIPVVAGSSSNDSKRFSFSENDKALMKMCGQILNKLMKHKRGYVFNRPVDVVAMGLHDYNRIVKQPMDLGTVKMKLGKKMYETPLDFASDVRLTFENAMLYNPKGHEVHELAGQLLFRFEDLFRPISVKCEMGQNQQPPQPPPWGCSIVEDLQESSWNRIKPEKKKKPKVMDIVKTSEQIQVHETVPYIATTNHLPLQSPVPTPSSPRQVSPVKRTKLPKPKAKDPNKREMSLEEKNKLGLGLQSLPDENMAKVVHIIKKRNQHLTEDGDEIELDIEAVDTETLWELDRFVTNWKKMVSKIKRQALMGNCAATTDGGMVAANGESDVAVIPMKKAKKAGIDGGEDDVDIGDDIPMSNFPPVEIEKDDGNGHASSSSSSSSGSSSGSSSSSDSDSGSSSGSDSDADNAQSKNFSRA